MKRVFYSVFIITLACCINSCYLITNSSDTNIAYTRTTATFTNALLDSNYAVCINLINLDNTQKSADLGGVRVGLDSLRSKIGRIFGRQLEFSFMNAQKPSDDVRYNLPPNTTLVSIEFHNTKEIGALQVLFDDRNGKIDNIKSLEVRDAIPNMSKFWLFGLAALVVVVFNIVAIVLALKSKLKWKWLYCIAIILVNIPSIQYSAMRGVSFRLWQDQYLLGVDFQKIGYLGSFWSVGIPIAAIFTIFRVMFYKPKVVDAQTPVKPAGTAPTAKSRVSKK